MEAAVCQSDPFSKRHAIRIDRKQIVVLPIAEDARMVDARHDAATADRRSVGSSARSPTASRAIVLRRSD